MIYSDFQGKKISMLGLGCMRLPVDAQGNIDEAQVAEMTKLAFEGGVNYFDTAYPYHGGESERVMGRVLANYPRDSFYLATKYPGHQISSSYDPAAIFEEQLEKCGVEYFDFYLLHNVCESSIGVYRDPRWGIVEYFLQQKANGRIKHLGFSSHGKTDNLREFLQEYGDKMEFCQIQLNYMDWTLQDAKGKCALLNEYHIPIWVMEPVRGGKLAALPEGEMAKLQAAAPGLTAAQWAFRWLQGIEGVSLVLSGMSNLEQMRQNIETFARKEPLSAEQIDLLMEVAEGMKNSVPCTACRYCCDGCPMGLDIPGLLGTLNEVRFGAAANSGMFIEALPADKQPSACIGCGACSQICPQQIDIPAALAELTGVLAKMPSWAEICREREEAAKRSRALAGGAAAEQK